MTIGLKSFVRGPLVLALMVGLAGTLFAQDEPIPQGLEHGVRGEKQEDVDRQDQYVCALP